MYYNYLLSIPTICCLFQLFAVYSNYLLFIPVICCLFFFATPGEERQPPQPPAGSSLVPRGFLQPVDGAGGGGGGGRTFHRPQERLEVLVEFVAFVLQSNAGRGRVGSGGGGDRGTPGGSGARGWWGVAPSPAGATCCSWKL